MRQYSIPQRVRVRFRVCLCVGAGACICVRALPAAPARIFPVSPSFCFSPPAPAHGVAERARESARERKSERVGARRREEASRKLCKKNLRAFPLSGCFPAVWAAIACMYAMRNQIWRDTLGRSSEGFWLVVHGDENLFRFSIDVWF